MQSLYKYVEPINLQVNVRPIFKLINYNLAYIPKRKKKAEAGSGVKT